MKTLPEMLKCLRGFGYRVGVHNDYEMKGRLFTFWLFTHPETGTFLQGEGTSDELAIQDVLDQLPEKYRMEVKQG